MQGLRLKYAYCMKRTCRLTIFRLKSFIWTKRRVRTKLQAANFNPIGFHSDGFAPPPFFFRSTFVSLPPSKKTLRLRFRFEGESILFSQTKKKSSFFSVRKFSFGWDEADLVPRCRNLGLFPDYKFLVLLETESLITGKGGRQSSQVVWGLPSEPANG